MTFLPPPPCTRHYAPYILALQLPPFLTRATLYGSPGTAPSSSLTKKPTDSFFPFSSNTSKHPNPALESPQNGASYSIWSFQNSYGRPSGSNRPGRSFRSSFDDRNPTDLLWSPSRAQEKDRRSRSRAGHGAQGQQL